MKNYFILLLLLQNLLFSSTSYSQNQPTLAPTCNCFRNQCPIIKEYCRKFSRFSLSEINPKDPDYQYYLINIELEKKKIKNPIYYFECNNNFHLHNDTLFNCLNYRLDYYSRYPDSFKNRNASNPNEFREKYTRCIENNYRINNLIKERFRNLYRYCYLAGHNNPLTLYDHGFLAFTEGNSEEAMNCAEKYINLLKKENLESQIQPQEMLLLGQSYLELNEYSKAIQVLSDLIEKDPTNKEAYLNRSFAYFETGSFEEALLDFNLSDKEKSLLSPKNEASNEFSQALMSSLYEGSAEAIVDFVPSLCESAYGLGSALWVGVQSPIESSKNFADACYEIGECVVDYCKTVDRDILDGYIDQIKILHANFDNLSDKDKGELIGYTIGRYGVDFFAGGVALKSINAFRNLKAANSICNLEAMATSLANKEALISSSLKHAADRNAYFNFTKVHWGKQGKHMPVKHNFVKGKGIIALEDSELEFLLKKHSGKGSRVRGSWGEPDYKERVDFGKIIGEFALDEKGKPVQYFPTTKGIIHYAKDGFMHVVPSNPNTFINY